MEVRVLSSAQVRGQARARGLAGRRLLCKEKIVGSNPTGSTLCKVQSPVKDRPPSRVVKYVSGRSSAVERLLAKEKVVSSNLIARSTGSAIVPTLLTAKWLNAEVAQSVEHSTENAGVPSSSLGLGTRSFPGLRLGQHSGIV